jgi:hypothetical protein
LNMINILYLPPFWVRSGATVSATRLDFLTPTC